MVLIFSFIFITLKNVPSVSLTVGDQITVAIIQFIFNTNHYWLIIM